MAAKKLTKEQRQAVSAARRAQRMRDARANIGETISQKIGLSVAAYANGALPRMGPVCTSTIGLVAGYGLAVVMGGKVGAAAEGIGDASLTVALARQAAKRRAESEPTSWMRNPFFGDATQPAIGGVDATPRALMAARAAGLREGIRAGVVGATGVAFAGEPDEADEDMLNAALGG